MFKRVLIAEDYESVSISVQKTLADLGITLVEYTYYCDDALMLVKKGLNTDEPFDLLITDLSFDEDHRTQNIKGGTELIKAVREVLPNIKVLVFSAEKKAAVIDALFKDLKINAYVPKARHDAKDLKIAINTIYSNKIHLSDDLKPAIKQKNAHEFTDFDITIISLLAEGEHQKNIPLYLQKNNIKPSGLSSVEKRLSLIKEVLDFSKNEQLVAYCKDFGII